MNMLLIAGSQSATTLYLEGSSRRYTDTFDLPKEIAVSDQVNQTNEILAQS